MKKESIFFLFSINQILEFFIFYTGRKIISYRIFKIQIQWEKMSFFTGIFKFKFTEILQFFTGRFIHSHSKTCLSFIQYFIYLHKQAPMFHTSTRNVFSGQLAKGEADTDSLRLENRALLMLIHYGLQLSRPLDLNQS